MKIVSWAPKNNKKRSPSTSLKVLRLFHVCASEWFSWIIAFWVKGSVDNLWCVFTRKSGVCRYCWMKIVSWAPKNNKKRSPSTSLKVLRLFHVCASEWFSWIIAFWVKGSVDNLWCVFTRKSGVCRYCWMKIVSWAPKNNKKRSPSTSLKVLRLFHVCASEWFSWIIAFWVKGSVDNLWCVFTRKSGVCRYCWMKIVSWAPKNNKKRSPSTSLKVLRLFHVCASEWFSWIIAFLVKGSVDNFWCVFTRKLGVSCYCWMKIVSWAPKNNKKRSPSTNLKVLRLFHVCASEWFSRILAFWVKGSVDNLWCVFTRNSGVCCYCWMKIVSWAPKNNKKRSPSTSLKVLRLFHVCASEWFSRILAFWVKGSVDNFWCVFTRNSGVSCYCWMKIVSWAPKNNKKRSPSTNLKGLRRIPCLRFRVVFTNNSVFGQRVGWQLVVCFHSKIRRILLLLNEDSFLSTQKQ